MPQAHPSPCNFKVYTELHDGLVQDTLVTKLTLLNISYLQTSPLLIQLQHVNM